MSRSAGSGRMAIPIRGGHKNPGRGSSAICLPCYGLCARRPRNHGLGENMWRPGDYADALRSLGRFLDHVEARTIEVQLVGETLGVSWLGLNAHYETRKYRLF